MPRATPTLAISSPAVPSPAALPLAELPPSSNLPGPTRPALTARVRFNVCLAGCDGQLRQLTPRWAADEQLQAHWHPAAKAATGMTFKHNEQHGGGASEGVGPVYETGLLCLWRCVLPVSGAAAWCVTGHHAVGREGDVDCLAMVCESEAWDPTAIDATWKVGVGRWRHAGFDMEPRGDTAACAREWLRWAEMGSNRGPYLEGHWDRARWQAATGLKVVAAE